ncbi:regulator of protease activity HflC (stomatin/prohibitin superfamily) [Dyadobacter jejuensis]|uniref:Regulator of protease activity HflC (Stomatin/prohibitin superfamily) n=1 Tax=Dyadobacter jejuensis TaxID=1082580 RepID=A0A316AQD5_9BACT|nr:prohibitin family protein [Dyadobacter jejuensis]PWJ59479.1 regulator of protease activity HflC (stomatin/prohibitin superfamily) [Dyadobacter jejuensis]
MFFLTIGLLILITGYVLQSSDRNIAQYTRYMKIVGVALVLVGGLTASIRQIDAGTIGVQSLFGKVSDRVLENGLNLVNPLVTVAVFDTKTQNYTMAAITNEGELSGDDAIRVLSADGLEVVIDLTVLYKVLPSSAPSIFKDIGTDYKDKIVRPVTRTRIRDNAVYYDAVSLYSKRRDEFQDRIYKSIDKDFKDRGLILEQLLIRNINLPESVKKSIESKINAEQDAQKMEFVLQKEKQEAERMRVEAQGIADYQTIIAQSLTDRQLQYEMINAQKELAKSPNAKIVIMGGKSNMPLILN